MEIEAREIADSRRERVEKKVNADRLAEVERFLSMLYPPGEGHVYELRFLEIKGRGAPRQGSGYFDDNAKAARAAIGYDLADCLGAYITVNPVVPDCFPRGPNKVIDYAKKTTGQREILRYRWVVIDCDPKRPSGVPATQGQLDAALTFAGRVKIMLAKQFDWPAPAEGVSGNGAYLLYRIDLPNDDATRQLVEGVLKAIMPLMEREEEDPAAANKDIVIDVDESMFDLNQLIRVLGTLNKKGHPTQRQPHRRSRLSGVPEAITTLTPEQLQRVASFAPARAAARGGTNGRSGSTHSTNGQTRPWTSRLKVAEWLTNRGRTYRIKSEPDHRGRTVYVLAECPFNSSHGDPDSCVMQAPSGQLSAQCFHNSCAAQGWQEFKQRIGPPEPHHYDPPLRPKTQQTAADDEEQAEADDAALAELRATVKADAQAGMRQALKVPWLSVLTRLKDRDPGGLELFYQALKDAKATARDITALRSAVKDEGKRLKKERAAAARAAKRPPEGRTTDGQPAPVVCLTNCYEQWVPSDGGEGRTDKVGHTVQYLAQQVRQLTREWPKRVGKLLFARAGDAPLFAWISQYLQHDFTTTAKKPIPNPIEWMRGPSMVSEARFFSYLQQTVEDFDSIEVSPHHPPMERTYYLHPSVEGGDGKALCELVAQFCPATTIDADLIEAIFLSLLWGGPSGWRPAVLITGEDEEDEEKGRGVGKSTLARMFAALVGGAISLSSNEDFGELKTRLLSPDALRFRVAILDNIKSLKFSWGELEGLITANVISGRRMYHGEGQRPNTLTYILTLNGASLSKDLAQRCVIIKLKRPEKHDGDWEERTLRLIHEKRWAIMGDIIARLKAPAKPMERHTRWGAWEDAVLARLPEPNDAQQVIMERQGEVDDDAGDAMDVRHAFIQELLDRQHYPDRETVRIPVSVAAAVLARATRENWPTGKATTHLRTLYIEELRYSKSNGARYWVWKGKESLMTSAMSLKPRPQPEGEKD